MEHIVLLGDSIFDNRAYVSGPDVVAQLRAAIPAGWHATLLAVDGHLAGHIPDQLEKLPGDATFLVVSAGGNNALQLISRLGQGVELYAEVLIDLAYEQAAFEKEYEAAIRTALGKGRPVGVCTVYYPNFPEPELQESAKAVLAVFNDVILRTAFRHHLPVIDLRAVCDEAADFANPIEPSEHGGEKIVRAILELVRRRRANETAFILGW